MNQEPMSQKYVNDSRKSNKNKQINKTVKSNPKVEYSSKLKRPFKNNNEVKTKKYVS